MASHVSTVHRRVTPDPVKGRGAWMKWYVKIPNGKQFCKTLKEAEAVAAWYNRNNKENKE